MDRTALQLGTGMHTAGKGEDEEDPEHTGEEEEPTGADPKPDIV